MLKFGMSEYEVNQNIVGVAVANFVVYGAVAGAIGASVIIVGVVGILKAFS